MGSIIDGTMAVMGIFAGFMLVFMSLWASEPMRTGNADAKNMKSFPVKTRRKAA